MGLEKIFKKHVICGAAPFIYSYALYTFRSYRQMNENDVHMHRHMWRFITLVMKNICINWPKHSAYITLPVGKVQNSGWKFQQKPNESMLKYVRFPFIKISYDIIRHNLLKCLAMCTMDMSTIEMASLEIKWSRMKKRRKDRRPIEFIIVEDRACNIIAHLTTVCYNLRILYRLRELVTVEIVGKNDDWILKVEILTESKYMCSDCIMLDKIFREY